MKSVAFRETSAYRDRSFVNAVQWAAGLEWFLLVKDPWRIALSTGHPNGATFLAYPEIVQLLMDRTYRQEVLKRVPPKARQRSTLADLGREYSLNEIAIISRAGPARLLGVGADADVTIYTPGRDRRAMFSLPRYVLKGGVVVVEQGEVWAEVFGPTLCAATEYDEGVLPDVRALSSRCGGPPRKAVVAGVALDRPGCLVARPPPEQTRAPTGGRATRQESGRCSAPSSDVLI
jgi:formylmethanofuran dehydrogenase subunit A